MTTSRLRKTSRRIAAVVTACATLALLAPMDLAQAAPLYPGAMPAQGGTDMVLVRGGARGGGGRVGGGAVHAAPRSGAVVHRGAVVRGPAGGAAVRRTAVVGAGGVAVRHGAWARPGRYRWPVGGAIAAGAAIGFVAAATAAAWAGPPPSDGLCWYYTDPSRTQGFWDYCPQ